MNAKGRKKMLLESDQQKSMVRSNQPKIMDQEEEEDRISHWMKMLSGKSLQERKELNMLFSIESRYTWNEGWLFLSS